MLNTSTDIMIWFLLVSIAIFAFIYIINQPKDSPNKTLNLVLVILLGLIPLSMGAVKLFSGLKFPAAAPAGPSADAKYEAEKALLITDLTNLAPVLKTIASVGEERYNDIASDPDAYEGYRNRSMSYVESVNALVKKYATNAFETKVRDKVSDLTNLLKEAQSATRNFKGVFADENGADFGTYQGPASRALGLVTAITNGL